MTVAMTKSKLTKLKVDDLRQMLLSYGESEETVASLTKEHLIDVIGDYIEAAEIEADEIRQASENDEFKIEYIEEEESETAQDHLPKYGSPEWQEFVMSQFTPSELFEGCPKSFALRRVAQDLLGPVIAATASVVNVTPQDGRRAVTINYQVDIEWTLDFNFAAIDINSISRNVRSFSGVADAVENPNCKFFRHPAATAETKAMGRAYKNALCLNVTTSEEKMSGYDSDMVVPEAPNVITPQLLKMIKVKSEHLKKDAHLTLKNNLDSITGGVPKTLGQLDMEEGKLLYALIDS